MGSSLTKRSCTRPRSAAGTPGPVSATTMRIFEQLELAGQQLDGLAGACHLAREQVHFEVATGQRRLRRLAAAASGGALPDPLPPTPCIASSNAAILIVAKFENESDTA